MRYCLKFWHCNLVLWVKMKQSMVSFQILLNLLYYRPIGWHRPLGRWILWKNATAQRSEILSQFPLATQSREVFGETTGDYRPLVLVSTVERDFYSPVAQRNPIEGRILRKLVYCLPILGCFAQYRVHPSTRLSELRTVYSTVAIQHSDPLVVKCEGTFLQYTRAVQ